MNQKQRREKHPAIQVNKNIIYIYHHPGYPKHEGYLKIGETERTAEERVKEDHRTNDVSYEILATFDAVDDNGGLISDKEIHQFLRRQGVDNLLHESGSPSEWFRISLEDINRVISNRQHFIDDFQFLKSKPVSIVLRPNQQEALEKTYSRWQISQQNKASSRSSVNQFLWNAKPRFGKTLTAYEFAKKIAAKNVLVMTQRTSISNAWFSDYHDHIRSTSNYLFGSSKENKIEINNILKDEALSPIESSVIANDKNKSLIYYTTLANIKGHEEGEFKQKNKWIYSTCWDLIILDETHEGTDTARMDKVLQGLEYGFLLELSGTPFRKMNENKGYNSRNTYSWSYSQEQEAKENWNYKDGPNPYLEMPKLNIYTFQVPANVRAANNLSEYSFDFNEFFKNDGDNFLYDDQINNFLDLLHNQNNIKDSQAQYYPFADDKTRFQLRHTFWKLPSTSAVRLLARKLRDNDRHTFFKDYRIIEAADSKNGQNSMNAEKQVKSAIGNYGLKTKTITLSVDMLTTGTTIKEWTGIIMLDNSTSSSKYVQTAFRAQTPWNAKLDEGGSFVKTDAYVFDFNPDRVLKVVEEYANIDIETSLEISNNGSSDRRHKTQALLNFMPIVAMDSNGEMKYLDANDAMDIIHYTNVHRIVDSGFMANELFNVKALFNMRGKDFEKARGLIQKVDPVVANKKNKTQEPLDKSNIEEEIEVETAKVISESGLGEKKRAFIESVLDENGASDLELVIEKYKEKVPAYTTEDIESIKDIVKDLKEPINKQKKEEEKVRNHLRGFARTIPVFLMAYGNRKMNSRNFDQFIGNEDFLQVTGLTKDEFRYLRQAKSNDGEPVFNETLFDSSISQFLKDKKALAHYYLDETTDDIYNRIKSQESNRVFTSKKIVNQMLDIFEEENPGFFRSEKVKLLDPYAKSGNFLAEAAKRFYKYSRDKNIKRIIENQLYAITPFHIYATLAQETVYGFADKDFKNKLRNKNIQPEPHIHEIIKQPDGLSNIIKEHFGEDMKFDVIIGNPPYQEEIKGRRDAPSLYHKFMDEAYSLANKVCFITPARFLFNQGNTPSKWNQKMLNDLHLKVMYYQQNSAKVFDNTDIKGGVAITYRDTNKHFGKIGTFTHFEELNSLLKKVDIDDSLSDIYHSTDSYHFTDLLHVDFPGAKANMSKGHEYDIKSSIFTRFSEIGIFHEEKNNPDDIKFIGLIKNKRYMKYISNDYVKKHPNLNKFKVMLPGSNGSGAIGEVLSTPLVGEPLVGEPLVGHTQTFISFGAFDNRQEAENLLKYIKTKFARTLLGTLKITQSNKKDTWRNVPIQDFTLDSDIDWAQPVANIDQQLYKKYNLDEKEINFIEEKIREME